MYSRVYVEITNICNMNCSFCHGHSRAPRQMTQAEYARVLEQLQGKTRYIYHHLMGEPLIHPQLPRFIEMARAAGFRPMITTNGTLLQRFGSDLLGKGLHKVNISLHRRIAAISARSPPLRTRPIRMAPSSPCGFGTTATTRAEMPPPYCPCGKACPVHGPQTPGAIASGTGFFWNGATASIGRIRMPPITAGRSIATACWITSASSATER